MPPSGPILFYRPGGLGDVLSALPALRLVRGVYPERTACLAASGAPGRLARRLGLADRFLPIDDPGLAGLFAGPDSGSARLEISIPAPSSLWAWFLREPAGAFRAAATRLFEDRAKIVVYNPASGESVGRDLLARTSNLLGLDPLQADYESLARLPDPGPPSLPRPVRPFAVLHPGSGSPRKNAPMPVFLGAVRELSGRGMDGFIVLGPAEEPLRAELEAARLPAGWRLLQEPPLEDLAALLARCSAYVGNDSGVTHLAAAAGAPVLAFFREENLPAWRPCGRTEVISAAEPPAIAVAVLPAALARFPASSALQWPL